MPGPCVHHKSRDVQRPPLVRLLRLLSIASVGLATPFSIAVELQPPPTTTATTIEPPPTLQEQQLQALEPLADLIASGESLTAGDYNAANTGRAFDLGKNGLVKLFGRPCEQITVGEILLAQSQHQLHAAGRYQIIGITMRSAVRWAGLSGSDLFTPENQDRLFMALLKHKRPLVWSYLNSGHVSQHSAADALSREWASIPYWDNTSYYGRGDHAHVPRHLVLSTLDDVRSAFSLFG